MKYAFKLRDFQATKKRHLVRIRKLEARLLSRDLNNNYHPLEDWLGEAKEIISSKVHNDDYYMYNTQRGGRLTDRTKQSVIKEVKTFVNRYAREWIREWLVDNDLPESWDTAFYCLYYRPINKIMRELVVEKQV